jgi:hypothetical protein
MTTKFDQDEVWTKVIALFESFPTPCSTLDSDVGKRSNLTPDPSFAHNLGCRCPNDQCEGILDIYTSRTFQWHQEHPTARCFGLWFRSLNVWESQKTPNLQLWEWEFHPPTSPKVGLQQDMLSSKSILQNKKKKTRMWHVQDKNSIKFYCMNETRKNMVVTRKCTQNWCWIN